MARRRSENGAVKIKYNAVIAVTDVMQKMQLVTSCLPCEYEVNDSLTITTEWNSHEHNYYILTICKLLAARYGSGPVPPELLITQQQRNKVQAPNSKKDIKIEIPSRRSAARCQYV